MSIFVITDIISSHGNILDWMDLKFFNSSAYGLIKTYLERKAVIKNQYFSVNNNLIGGIP